MGIHMKKNRIYRVAVLAAVTIGMTACGKQEVGGNASTQEQHTAEWETQEPEVQGDETQEPSGEQSAEDKDAEQGGQTATEDVVLAPVDLLTETDAVREQGLLMLQNLELAEYLNEAVNLISTDEWMNTMLQGISEGSRSYYVKRNDEIVLMIQVGYQEAKEVFANVYYLGEEIRVIRRLADAVQLGTTQPETDSIRSYEIWTCDGSNGAIYQEKGSFINGVLTGDYVVAVHQGDVAGDVFSLWNNKTGMNYIYFTGNFDEQGKTTQKQPFAEQLQGENGVVYAYDESGENALFLQLPQNVVAENYVFSIDLYEMNLFAGERFGWQHTVIALPKEETTPGQEDANTDWTPDLL